MNLKLLAALASLGLAACTLGSHLPAQAPRVDIGGQAWSISQLTAGTWTATAHGRASAAPATQADRTALLSAIEKASGCRVTDSDYTRQGLQLDAQVDCGGRLKN